MKTSNQDNINKWSQFPLEEIKKFGDDGDVGRVQMLNPAIFTLLGSVNRKKILDVGSGNGYLSRKLVKLGATVVAIEPADSLYKYSLEREKTDHLGITYLQQDVSLMTTFKEEFDAVVANMVFMDIPDYKLAIKNCISALKKDGVFIFSLLHPCFPGFESDWEKLGHVEIDNYFHEYSIPATYGEVFYRPLQNYINIVNDFGCVTERIIEPQLNKEFSKNEKAVPRSFHVPQFIVVKCRKIQLSES